MVVEKLVKVQTYAGVDTLSNCLQQLKVEPLGDTLGAWPKRW